jgi:hypothetical protein
LSSSSTYPNLLRLMMETKQNRTQKQTMVV